MSSGRALCNLGVASSRRYQMNNEWQEQTSFFNLAAWGDLGENVAATLKKGDRIVVSGRLEARSYEDAEGNKKTVHEIVVDEIGPSLRWARATVERVTRTQGGDQPAKVGGNNVPDPVYGEEPF